MKEIILKHEDEYQIPETPDKFGNNWGYVGFVGFTPEETIDIEDKILGSHSKNSSMPDKDFPEIGDIFVNKNGNKYKIVEYGGFVTGINAWFKVEKLTEDTKEATLKECVKNYLRAEDFINAREKLLNDLGDCDRLLSHHHCIKKNDIVKDNELLVGYYLGIKLILREE